MSIKLKFWLVGILLSAAGVILVRVVAGRYADQVGTQLVIFAVGVALALAGLGMIMAGMRKR